jgi:hypothetical protein
MGDPRNYSAKAKASKYRIYNVIYIRVTLETKARKTKSVSCSIGENEFKNQFGREV